MISKLQTISRSYLLIFALLLLSGWGIFAIVPTKYASVKVASGTDSLLYNLQQQNISREWLSWQACFHTTREIVRKEKPTVKNQLFLSNLAIETGWYEQAIDFSINAFQIAKTSSEKKKSLLLLWQCYLNIMDTTRADEIAERLKQYQSELNNDPERLQYLVLKGYSNHNKENQIGYIEGLKWYHKALQLNQRVNTNDSVWLAFTYQKIGNTFNDVLRDTLTGIFPRKVAYDSAKFYYNKALIINKVLYPSVHPRIGITYITLGMVERAFSQLTQAEQMYQKAFQHLTLNNFNIHPIYTSIALTQLSEIYFDTYKRTHEKKYINKSLQYDKKNNAFLRDELLNYATNAGRENLIKYFKQRSFQRVAKVIADTYQEGIYTLDSVTLQLSSESKYANAVKSQLLSSHDEGLEQNDRFRRIVSELNFLANATNNEAIKTVSSLHSVHSTDNDEKLFKSLTDSTAIKKYCALQNTTVLDYLIVDKKIFIHRFSANNATLIVRNINENLDENSVSRLLAFMKQNQTDSFQILANQFYKNLISGLVEKGSDRLIVIPHQYLSLLPWSALITQVDLKKNWSALKYTASQLKISEMVSINQLLLGKNVVKNKDIVCFAPSFSKEKRLPETEKFVNELRNSYAANIFSSGSSASKAIEHLQASILHFATHTTGENANFSMELNNGEKLNPASGQIGQCKANLVILNACETQKGKYFSGEGAYNLTRLFISNGCPAVISSLWKVDEGASAFYFSMLYKRLKSGEEKDKAINYIQNQFVLHPKYADWSNPYYWSGYVLTGSNAPILFE